MHGRPLFILTALCFVSFACSSPNENDIPLTAPDPGTPVVTGLYITLTSPEVIGIWGNPSPLAKSSGTSLVESGIPASTAFDNPYPNPSYGSCFFDFRLSQESTIDLWIVRARWSGDKNTDVSNSGGATLTTSRRVAVAEPIRNETMWPGVYRFTWSGQYSDGRLAPGGFYRVYLKVDGTVHSCDIFLFRDGTTVPSGLEKFLQF